MCAPRAPPSRDLGSAPGLGTWRKKSVSARSQLALRCRSGEASSCSGPFGVTKSPLTWESRGFQPEVAPEGNAAADGVVLGSGPGFWHGDLGGLFSPGLRRGRQMYFQRPLGEGRGGERREWGEGRRGGGGELGDIEGRKRVLWRPGRKVGQGISGVRNKVQNLN